MHVHWGVATVHYGAFFFFFFFFFFLPLSSPGTSSPDARSAAAAAASVGSAAGAFSVLAVPSPPKANLRVHAYTDSIVSLKCSTAACVVPSALGAGGRGRGRTEEASC